MVCPDFSVDDALFLVAKLFLQLKKSALHRLSSVIVARYRSRVKHDTIITFMIVAGFMVIATLLTLILVVASIRLRRVLRHFKIKKMYTAALEAPSVSVCIPARNETHAMTQCLERVLASDYRKMEIVVYDDRSKDDTSILVRSFAHAGVRFVPGIELPEGWLGRNHALEILAREASGTYVVFLDVDTFVQPNTISQLVGYTMTEKVKMVSVIPGRSDVWRVSVLFGHLRYLWELLFSRSDAPAVSGSAWIIDRHTLLDTLGGFLPCKDYVQPESYFAAKLGILKYHCLLNDHLLGVTYEKRWRSQVETGKRLFYPKIGGTWPRAVVMFVFLLLLNIPFLTIISGLFFGWTIIQTTALWLTLAYVGLYSVYTSRIWSKNWWIGGLLWPIVIFQELVIFCLSVWGYSRGTITWKGRPVMAAPQSVGQIKIDI